MCRGLLGSPRLIARLLGLFGLLPGFVLGFGLHFAAADDDAEQRLQTIRAAIEASRAHLLEYDRNERGLLEVLEAADESLSLLRREVSLAKHTKVQADRALEKVVAEERELALRRAATSRAMKRRAVALYKAGEVGFLAMLFSAEDLREFLDRSRILGRFLEQDQALLERYTKERIALEDARTRHERATMEQSVAKSTLEERLRDLSGERELKGLALHRARKDRRREREVLVELEAAARALEETLRTLQEDSGRRAHKFSREFAELEGRLGLPVDAPIIRGFGEVVDVEFRTKTFRKGVDFGARAGASVRAVAEGEVRFAGWFRGYGKIVILDHGDGFFTISGHLDEVGVQSGQVVQAGEAIGEAGETGSLSGPRLYFEIRHGSTAVDPEIWFGS